MHVTCPAAAGRGPAPGASVLGVACGGARVSRLPFLLAHRKAVPAVRPDTRPLRARQGALEPGDTLQRPEPAWADPAVLSLLECPVAAAPVDLWHRSFRYLRSLPYCLGMKCRPHPLENTPAYFRPLPSASRTAGPGTPGPCKSAVGSRHASPARNRNCEMTATASPPARNSGPARSATSSIRRFRRAAAALPDRLCIRRRSFPSAPRRARPDPPNR